MDKMIVYKYLINKYGILLIVGKTENSRYSFVECKDEWFHYKV